MSYRGRSPANVGVGTFSGAEKRRVDEQQHHVVQEALQHRRLHTSQDQVLGADRRPTDEQRQDLAHHNGLQKVPVEEEHFQKWDSELWFTHEIIPLN